MSRFKLIAFMALITLAFGVALVGDALAGEKFKCRLVAYVVKWEQVEVSDQEGHVVAIEEAKGINSTIMGKTLPDAMLYRLPALNDLNLKTGVGSHPVSYSEYTDRDGDKIIAKNTGKYPGGGSAAVGEWVFIKGTGKFEGIQGIRNMAWLRSQPDPVVCRLGRGSGAALKIDPSDNSVPRD
jgi:hypothetical protein